MKTICIGDLHGNDRWKAILEKEKNYDRIIFLGDYFDSKRFDIGIEAELENFKNILDLKNTFPEKVILLCGNHDLHYLELNMSICSGFQWQNFDQIHSILRPVYENGLLEMCFYDKDLKMMFSHAGISKKWYQFIFKKEENDPDSIAGAINMLFTKNPFYFEYLYEETEGDAESIQGPCWIRPLFLLVDLYENFGQVVGHSQVPEIQLHQNIYLTDTINIGKNYLIFENGNAVIKDF